MEKFLGRILWLLVKILAILLLAIHFLNFLFEKRLKFVNFYGLRLIPQVWSLEQREPAAGMQDVLSLILVPDPLQTSTQLVSNPHTAGETRVV